MATGTMKEAKVNTGTTVSIVDSPIPTPGPHQVLTKVIYSGCNPKDWERAEAFPDKHPFNQGDDIAGIVHAVGPAVSEFNPGDRVTAFHEMMTPGGSWAEYALSDAHATTYLPNHTPFEQGAAIPLAALTAAVGLYARLGLPQPWLPVKDDDVKIPLVVYVYKIADTPGVKFLLRSSSVPDLTLTKFYVEQG
ncbi:alcohol dehydrogenase-like protein [Teratosphaeria destructans]|uniref:Alcohol dehydrogenase-like protein n=1 Tax=Teratosphaeria destructans TaxID=418781 RepID=A0A9W7SX56_9PEZI|nr:alcohol dehydrogenase-like protein [Teratosphaeria destructans]